MFRGGSKRRLAPRVPTPRAPPKRPVQPTTTTTTTTTTAAAAAVVVDAEDTSSIPVDLRDASHVLNTTTDDVYVVAPKAATSTSYVDASLAASVASTYDCSNTPSISNTITSPLEYLSNAKSPIRTSFTTTSTDHHCVSPAVPTVRSAAVVTSVASPVSPCKDDSSVVGMSALIQVSTLARETHLLNEGDTAAGGGVSAVTENGVVDGTTVHTKKRIRRKNGKNWTDTGATNGTIENVSGAASKRIRLSITDQELQSGHLLMKDFIYRSPASHPMRARVLRRQEQREKRQNKKNKSTTTTTAAAINVFGSDNGITETELKKEEEDCTDVPETLHALLSEKEPVANTIAPQVTIDADGRIVIDQLSLTQSTGTIHDALDEPNLISESGKMSTYNSYTRRTAAEKWTANETKLFFDRLALCGTDFDLMAQFFPKKTRAQLKNKFKREDRRNERRVSEALVQQSNMNLPELSSSTSDVKQNILISEDIITM